MRAGRLFVISTAAALVGCVATEPPASLYSEATFQAARRCTQEKSIRFSLNTSETAEAVATAAFDGCAFEWQRVAAEMYPDSRRQVRFMQIFRPDYIRDETARVMERRLRATRDAPRPPVEKMI